MLVDEKMLDFPLDNNFAILGYTNQHGQCTKRKVMALIIAQSVANFGD